MINECHVSGASYMHLTKCNMHGCLFVIFDIETWKYASLGMLVKCSWYRIFKFKFLDEKIFHRIKRTDFDFQLKIPHTKLKQSLSFINKKKIKSLKTYSNEHVVKFPFHTSRGSAFSELTQIIIKMMMMKIKKRKKNIEVRAHRIE